MASWNVGLFQQAEPFVSSVVSCHVSGFHSINSIWFKLICHKWKGTAAINWKWEVTAEKRRLNKRLIAVHNEPRCSRQLLQCRRVRPSIRRWLVDWSLRLLSDREGTSMRRCFWTPAIDSLMSQRAILKISRPPAYRMEYLLRKMFKVTHQLSCWMLCWRSQTGQMATPALTRAECPNSPKYEMTSEAPVLHPITTKVARGCWVCRYWNTWRKSLVSPTEMNKRHEKIWLVIRLCWSYF